MQEAGETRVRSLGGENPLEDGMVTCSSILAWRIPWTEEPGGLQPMGSQRVGHDWSDSATHSAVNSPGSDTLSCGVCICRDLGCPLCPPTLPCPSPHFTCLPQWASLPKILPQPHPWPLSQLKLTHSAASAITLVGSQLPSPFWFLFPSFYNPVAISGSLFPPPPTNLHP